jgi:hypothetical protein
MKCPHDIGGVCQSMICLESTACGSRDRSGAPNYAYLVNTTKAERKPTKGKP